MAFLRLSVFFALVCGSFPRSSSSSSSCFLYCRRAPRSLIRCSDMQCCEEVKNLTAMGLVLQADADMVLQMARRCDLEANLIRQIATLTNPMNNVSHSSFDINSRPMNAETMHAQPLNIALHFHVFHIAEISQKKQTFKMHYKLKWTWRDCRVQFFAVEEACGNIIEIGDNHVLWKNFWRPDSMIHEREDDIEAMRKHRLSLGAFGETFYVELHSSTFRCHFDFRDMPFDEQRCKLTIGVHSPSYLVDIFWDAISAEDRDFAEWQIPDTDKWKTSKYYDTRDWSNSSRLSVEFVMKRQPGFLTRTYVWPGILFYLLSWVGLWIDIAAVPARVTVGLIPVLILTNLTLSSLASIPPVTYYTRLSLFMMLTVFLTVLHMLEFGAVHYSMRRWIRLVEEKRVREQKQHEEDCEPLQPAHPNATDVPAPQAPRHVKAPSFLMRMDIKLVWFLHNNLDEYTRGVSLVLYIMLSCIVFFA